MAISFLQQQAFITSPDFRGQVNGIVRKQALYWFPSVSDATLRTMYAQVTDRPDDFGFVQTVVADSAWALTYDAWATDPEAQSGMIEGYVQKWWTLRTGIPVPA